MSFRPFTYSFSLYATLSVHKPAIFISGNSLGKAVIAGLLAQNVLDMMVELPPGLFTHTGIASVLQCKSKAGSPGSTWKP